MSKVLKFDDNDPNLKNHVMCVNFDGNYCKVGERKIAYCANCSFMTMVVLGEPAQVKGKKYMTAQFKNYPEHPCPNSNNSINEKDKLLHV